MIAFSAEGLAPATTALGLRLILDLLLKGLLVLAISFGLAKLARGGSPRRRSAIWTTVICVLLLVPSTVLLTPRLTAPLVTVTEAVVISSAVSVDTTGEIVSALQPAPGHPGSAEVLEAIEPLPALPAWWVMALLAWAVGSAGLLLRTGWRLIGAHWVNRNAEQLQDERIDRIIGQSREPGCCRVRILVSPNSPLPFVTGLIRSVIVLPAAALTWRDHELVAVLRHELSHLRRRDLWRLLAADLACALHWPNPLVWLAARRAALAHEMACDDQAVRAGSSPREYAQVLLAMASALSASARSVPAPGLARVTQIEARLHQVLAPAPSGVPASRRGRLLGAAGVILCVMLCVLVLISVSAVRIVPIMPIMPDAAVADTAAPASREEPIADSAPDIHSLVLNAEVEAVLRLLEARPDLIEQRDPNGMTPLALAAWHDQPQLVAALLAHGADPNPRNAIGLTPVFSALDRGRVAMARLLADGGADLQVNGYHNWTLMHAAARIGAAGFVRRLLDAGHDPDPVSTLGRTPLHLARRHDFRETIDLLLTAGAQDTPNPHPWSDAAKIDKIAKR